MAEPHTVLILALDTTTRAGSIAVVRTHEAPDGRHDVLSLVIGNATRSHSERLPGELADALDRAGVPRTAIDLLAVATGPGAFTGLRIGLASVQGLAMTLNRPAIGISALDALVVEAGAVTAELVAPWMDAQRGEVFGCLHGPVEAGAAGRREIEPPVAALPAALLEQWRSIIDGRSVLFTGDAVARDSALISDTGGGRWALRTPGALAPAVATLGGQGAANGLAGPPHALTPIYVRRPDAEIEREQRNRP